MKIKQIRRRYVRRSKFSRLRKIRSVYRNWLATQNTRLAATGDLVNFTASAAVQATEAYTFTGQPADGETVTIGGQIYTFKDALASGGLANEVLIGGSSDATKDNLIAAVNNAAGEGTTYGNDTLANAHVTAVSGGVDIMDVTAIVYGENGNEIAVSTDVVNASWGAALLSGGTDTVITSAAHGLELGDGAFRLSNSGGALPAGLLIDTDYFVVEVPDGNSLKLGLSRDSDPEQATDTGTGTHSYAKCDDDDECIHDALKTNTSERIAAATDIDDLA